MKLNRIIYFRFVIWECVYAQIKTAGSQEDNVE